MPEGTPEPLALGRLDVASASEPQLTPDGLIVSLQPPTTTGLQRSEAYWEDSQGKPVRLTEGDVLLSEFTATLDLSGSAQDPDQWVVIWQLIGPDGTGQWPGPPITLHVSQGTWKVGGGEGYPGGSRETFVRPFPPFEDGTAVRWRIEVTISADPEIARVDVSMNDNDVIKDWAPPGGTLYPNQPWLLVKNGLYLAGGSEGPWGVQRDLKITDAASTVYRPLLEAIKSTSGDDKGVES